ncbi:hypothetical protein EVAR_24076_1 [Eumeta japonica]|uniref:Uncharacterized protein n=1 Tax=Eumeta variegata TaxID=151549 RepID=A0A4C2A8G3_EUMVA|nr:hypothetical protein EVAR_24076_1 [Eumeta japonica]
MSVIVVGSSATVSGYRCGHEPFAPTRASSRAGNIAVYLMAPTLALCPPLRERRLNLEGVDVYWAVSRIEAPGYEAMISGPRPRSRKGVAPVAG